MTPENLLQILIETARARDGEIYPIRGHTFAECIVEGMFWYNTPLPGTKQHTTHVIVISRITESIEHKNNHHSTKGVVS